MSDPRDVRDTDSAARVVREMHALHGDGRPPCPGVVHVASAVRSPQGRLQVIAIGPDAPKSDTDFFVLQLSRARADAIVTTAQILRAEPDMSFAFAGPWACALAHYRLSLGKARPPSCVVLTRNGELPRDHPVWRDGSRHTVLTTEAAAPRVAALLGTRAEVVSHAAPDARAAIQLLRERGAHTVSIEAGPSTASSLYEPPSAVDELWLSIAEVETTPQVLGFALPRDEVLFAGLRCVADTPRDEQSGRWRFQRWLRTST